MTHRYAAARGLTARIQWTHFPDTCIKIGTRTPRFDHEEIR